VSALVQVDGRDVHRTLRLACDVAVVGSGPAGATVARGLASRGVAVVVLEEGHHTEAAQFRASALPAMASLYRDMGTSMAFGNNPMPYLQGRCVGGTSVINGGISWQFPRDVYDAWVAADPALAASIPFARLQHAESEIEARLDVHPTEDRVAGAKNLAMARGADALGWEHRAIRRNADGCRGSGRCLQGCPHGAKMSMDRTFLPDAAADGARIVAGVRIDRVLWDRRGAYGVRGLTAGGADVEVRTHHAVVLAASAIQTPILLRRSGLCSGPVGDQLSGHPGVSVTGRFDEPVRNYAGATQGHEITGLRPEGLKLEALGFDLGILASRIPGAGPAFARRIAEAGHYAVFGAALRADGRGTVRPGLRRPRVQYSLTPGDVRKARRAVRRLGEVLLAAGASEVYPGVPGFDPIVRDASRMAAIEEVGTLDPKGYAMSVTHLFGTARMGSDPATSVVRPDFRHHHVPGLYVADSAVFPTNLGVNPQIAIMTLARLCADHVCE
jgi:choline dehydrogenase-like flavoprotein